IPEEKRPSFRFVVDVRNPKRTANVPTRNVQLEFGPRFAALLQEVVVGVVGGVAVEIIEFAMVARGSRFQNHENCSAGANAVIGRVVAVEGLELGDGVL